MKRMRLSAVREHVDELIEMIRRRETILLLDDDDTPLATIAPVPNDTREESER